MRGYISISMIMLKGLCFDFILISRRSRYRAGIIIFVEFYFSFYLNFKFFSFVSFPGEIKKGTRYLSRGVDENGRVANYVETEQILGLNNTLSSFVQTRGSIPVYWAQPTKNLKFNPTPEITRSSAATVFSLPFCK